MSKLNGKFILAVSLMFLASNVSFSAVRIKIDSNKSFNNIREVQNLDSRYYQFKLLKKITLPNGKIKYKYEQYYNDIPVWNNVIVSDANIIQNNIMSNIGLADDNITGSYLAEVEKDIGNINPKITKEEAVRKVKSLTGINQEAVLKDLSVALVIKNYAGVAKLIYIINHFFDDPNQTNPSRPYFIIDANTGDILEQWDGLTTLATDYLKGIGPGGNEKTGKYFYGKDYGTLIVTKKDNKCQMDSPNVLTMDFKHEPDWFETGEGGETHEFECTDEKIENTYKEINGGYSPINDAHYFGNVVYDMYKDWYKAAPLKFKLILKAHYRKNHDNAAWTGKVMLFGDGKRVFYPLVSLDVISHEVSHGFTEQNSNLIYKRQSGGMNESFSDIAGEAAKYYFNSNKEEKSRNDWMVGSSIFKGGADKALRYFADPTRDGKSIGHAKDYTNSLNVHYSSGVFNKAFYTLATKENWGLKKAFDAFVSANKTYWTQDSTFDEGGCGVKKAADDLGYDTDDVIKAFKVVGVNATCSTAEPDEPTDSGKPQEPKQPDEPKSPEPLPAPADAEQIKLGVPYVGLSGNKGQSKLFYIDLANKQSAINIWLWGGIGKPSMLVAYNKIPLESDADCNKSPKPNTGLCNVKMSNAGRYFIKLYAKEDFQDKLMWILLS